MTRWEYHVVKSATSGFWLGGHFDAEAFGKHLNELGAKGWELVSCFDTNQHQGASRDVIAILKRTL
jgi:hypothetical protein